MGKEIPNLNLTQEIETRIEQEPESIFAHLRGISSEYGMQRKEDFVESLDTSLARKTSRPIVLAELGEAGSSKTTLARDIIAEVFGYGEKKNTKTQKLMKTTGETILVEGIFWGDVSTLTKFLGRTTGKIFGEYLPKDNQETTKVFGENTARSLRESQNKRKIVIAEGIGVTGIPWPAGNPNNADRGLAAFWDLAGRKGPFKGLNYDVYWLGIVAEPAVKELAKSVREKLGNVVKDPQKAVNALREAGVEFDPEKIDEIIQWAHSSANLESIQKMERQTNELVAKLNETGKLGYIDVQKFMYEPDYRVDVIGKKLMRYVLEMIGVKSKSHVFIAHNYQPLPQFKFNTSVPIENTILKRYPEVARVQNKK